MRVEHQIRVDAPAATIFRFYEDVTRWPAWDPDTRAAWLDGPLRPGSRGQLTPTQGRTVPMLVTRVEADRCFTVESRIPLFRMVFDHELEPEGPATRVVHRVTLSGPLSLVIGPMLARRIDAGLPVTLSRLKALAEAAAGDA